MSNYDDRSQALQIEIAHIQDELQNFNAAIEVTTKKLKAKEIPESDINNFISATYNSVWPETNENQKASSQDTIVNLYNKYDEKGIGALTEPVQGKAFAEWDLKEKQVDLDALNTNDKSTGQKAQEESQPKEVTDAEQQGHLYPIKLVTTWTNKLKQYNKQLDDFIDGINEIPVTVDLTWLCKKIEAFCRRINYALALLRYEILKTMSQAYKQANILSKYIDPIINIQPLNILKCVEWAMNVLKFFLGPYETVLTFIKDFMTYTPPLVSEAGKLVGNVATMPAKLISKIDVNVEASGKDGEKKQIAEVYKEYIDIKFEPITMGEILGGGPEKPTYETANMTSQQKQIYDQQLQTCKTKIAQAWDDLISKVNAPGTYKDVWVGWPTKYNKLSQDVKYYGSKPNAMVASPNECETAQQVAYRIFGAKVAEKQDFYSKSFNTTQFPVYGMYNVDQFKQTLNSSLPSLITSYYNLLNKGTLSKSDQKSLEINRLYVDFLKAFSPQFPCIEPFLTNLNQLVKDSQVAISKAKDLDKPSVFD